MGWNGNSTKPLDLFRPYDTLTAEEINIIIKRYFSDVSDSTLTNARRIDLMNLLMQKAQ